MKYKVGDRVEAKIFNNLFDNYYIATIKKINKKKSFFKGYYGSCLIPCSTECDCLAIRGSRRDHQFCIGREEFSYGASTFACAC